MKEHVCVVCRGLPIAPFDAGDLDPAQEYRPKAPRPAPFGGPRSRRCTTHERAKLKAAKRRGRLKRRETVYGIDAETQQMVWELQGNACPCGRKAAPEPPPGVHMDHDHELAKLHDHPVDQGCRLCVTGFLCHNCNRNIVGRLSAMYSNRFQVAEALMSLASHILEPPMQRINEQQFDEEPA